MLDLLVALCLGAQTPPPPPEPSVSESAPESASAVASESPSVEELSAQGQAAVDAKDWQAAISAFTQARALAPEEPSVVYGQAFALRKAERLPEAVEAYRAHLELSPENADAWYALASVLEKLELAPEAAEAYRRYAEAERRPKYASYAVRAREKAEALDPRAPVAAEPQAPSSPSRTIPASAGLLPALEALQAQDFEGALDLVPESDNSARAQAARAGALLGLGRAADSEPAWRRALEGLQGPAAASARFGLAEALRAQGKLREAKTLYAQLLDDPETPPAISELARQR